MAAAAMRPGLPSPSRRRPPRRHQPPQKWHPVRHQALRQRQRLRQRWLSSTQIILVLLLFDTAPSRAFIDSSSTSDHLPHNSGHSLHYDPPNSQKYTNHFLPPSSSVHALSSSSASFSSNSPTAYGNINAHDKQRPSRNLTIGYLTAIKGGLKDRQGLAISGALTMALDEVNYIFYILIFNIQYHS